MCALPVTVVVKSRHTIGGCCPARWRGRTVDVNLTDMSYSAALSGQTRFGLDDRSRIRCYARPITLAALGVTIAGIFWFGSRYPALLAKARHTGEPIASMAFSHELFAVKAHDPLLVRILYGALNWLDAMRIGMTFGVLFGALLHTALRFYPLRIGRNYALNSLKGALVGVPMGVCANCAVPMACGVTRGHGRIEVALGYLFSSPNFNPVVVAMTFAILPWYFGAVKYLLLLFVILVLVPGLIQFLETRRGLPPLKNGPAADSCSLSLRDEPCETPFMETTLHTLREYARHIWMLLKPTVALMLVASLASSALLVLVPWGALLSTASPIRLMLASVIGVFMPVPIALDVMFATQLYNQGLNAGYVMIFLTTLGTYSIIPAVYLWREVSRALAVSLFAFFLVIGASIGAAFSALG